MLCKKILLLLSLVLSFPLYSKPEILILHSYDRNFEWTEDINQGFFETLNRNKLSYSSNIEYMDTKENDPELVFPYLYELYKTKYSKNQPDIIVLSDNNAFNFMDRYGNQLFPDTPLFFCGVNNITPDQFIGKNNITGINESNDIEKNIEVMLEIHSQLKNIYVITDIVQTGLLHEDAVRELVPLYENIVNIVPLARLSTEELLFSLKTLPEDSAVLFLSFFTDKNKRTYTAEESIRMITEASTAPVYAPWDWSMEWGIVGGWVTSGIQQGTALAELLISYMESGAIPEIIFDAPHTAMFEYSSLQNFNIPERDLPKGSLILNKPISLFSRFKFIIISTGIIFVLLLTLILVLSIDRKRKKRIQSELEKQKDLLQNIIENVPFLVFWTDKQNKLAGYNTPFKILLNSKRASELRMKLRKEQDIFLQKADSSSHHEIRINDMIYLLKMVKRYQTEEGILGVLIDVTQQKTMEDRIRQTQKLESLGRLAGGIAHDFNNLLTGIMGSAEIIKHNMLKEGIIQDLPHVQTIMSISQRAAELTKNLLSFARKAPMHTKIVSLDNIIKETINILERTVDKNIQLQFKRNKGEIYIKGDESLLQSAIMNLAINGCDAMTDSGGGKLSFTTDIEKVDREIRNMDEVLAPGVYSCLTITDTGLGIPPSHLEKIFEPFFTTKKMGKGNGLGLAGAFGCAISHGGILTVKSETEKGSSFRFYFPLQENPLTEIQKSAEGTKRVSGDGFDICITDDEPVITTFIRQWLEEAGFSTHVFHTGEQLLEYLSIPENRTDIVLLDVIMPGTRGDQMISRLKSTSPELKIILMSGQNEQEINDLSRHSADFFLSKPFSGQSLLNIIQMCLHS